MTNSTDKSIKKKPEKKPEKEPIKKKKSKKKGPIRLEAVIPVVLISALSIAYFYLFFDSHLRSGIELAATYGYGAEVNVGKIESRFLDGSLSVKGIQVTDKDSPERNLFQIGEIRFQFSWDALLRAKFVVDEASVVNIQALSPRKRPGRILPKEESAGESQIVNEVEEKALAELKESYNQNILGDVANLLDGTDPSSQISKMTADLKSEKKIQEIEKELKAKEAQWKARFAKLPQKPEVDALIARAKAIKLEGNALEVIKGIAEVDAVLKEADRIYKSYDGAQKDLKKDYSKVESDVGGIDKMIQNDINDLQKRLKIPSLNVADFSKGLFGRIFLDKLGAYSKYINMAKEYMPPPKKEEEEPSVQAHARETGRDIRFPITTGYPLFWLKKAIISSEPTDSKYSGRIKGVLKNATTDPIFLGKPFTAEIEGDFPHQQIQGLNLKLTMDHTKIPAKESFQMTIASFQVGEMVLSDSKDVRFAFSRATGESRVAGTLIENVVNLRMNNRYQQIQYDVKAKSPLLDSVLKGVAKDISAVTLNARATGAVTNPNIGINSNLGEALSRGFKKQLDAKVKEARQKLKTYVDDRIKAERAKLDQQLSQAKNRLNAEIGKHKKEIDNAKAEIEGRKKGAKSGPQKQLEDLKKKLKLPW
ncbi:TIGR03545 family protein [Bdellovibrionales bacterium]|nr:TIGR03545 family protein [Bdellovibrionales bacterium]